jgi:hypothetical protein
MGHHAWARLADPLNRRADVSLFQAKAICSSEKPLPFHRVLQDARKLFAA